MNKSNPAVSIITVVYQGAKFLESTIKSILNQTCSNYEYIIIDGGSADGTLDIIKKYENRITKWVSEPDNGLYDAMNKAINMSNGDYLWFINAGDQLYSNHTLENIFGTDNKTNADIYYGEAVIIDSNGNEIGLRRQKVPEKLIWKSLKMGLVVSHQAFIVKRSLAPLYNLSYKYSADIDWVIRSLKVSKDIIHTKQILSYFLDGGRSKQTIIPSLKERFLIMAHFYGLFPTILYHFPIAFKFVVFLIRNNRF